VKSHNVELAYFIWTALNLIDLQGLTTASVN